MNIPQGAVVTEAYLEFTAYSTVTYGNPSMRIRGVADDDSSDFHPDPRNRLRNLHKTMVSTWSLPAFYNTYTIRTPDLSNVVRPIA